MNSKVDSAVGLRARPAPASGRSGTRLAGGSLLAARVAWVLIILSTATVFISALPSRQAQLLEIVHNLSPSQELILREQGVSLDQHAGIVMSVEALVPAVFFAVGMLIFWRRSDDWVAMLVSASLTTYAGWSSPVLDALIARGDPLTLPATLIQVLGMSGTLIFLYLFPSGRFVPRWTLLLLAVWGLWVLGWLLAPGSIFDFTYGFQISLLSFVLLMAWLGTGMAAQVYRYLRESTPIQRQQTKLIIFGCSVGIIGYLVFGFDRFAVPELAQPLYARVVYDLIGVPLFLLTSLIIPVAFAFSILRYRLWEIDLVINRTLVYGTLTAVLAGLYTASIALSQRLFVALTGEKSDAAIVFTTLVVASAFTPVKGRLQAVVDRYVMPVPDPMKQVRALGEQMRSFLDLIDVEQVTKGLLDRAVRAFGASGGAVYLRDHGSFVPTYVHGDWNQVEGMTVWLESHGIRFGWVAVGPRLSGLGYSPQDEELFSEVSSLVAQAMVILRERSDLASR